MLKKILSFTVGLLCLATVSFAYPVVTNQGTTFQVANDTSTGTVVNELVIYSTANPARAIQAPAGTTSGILGIATQGAGVTGSVLIQNSGFANCEFDGPTTAGDSVQPSATTAGNCHDTGGTSTSGSIGQVSSTNASAGTYSLLLYASASSAAAQLPINSGPAQTGNYNAQNFQFTNVNGLNGAIYATDLSCGTGTDQSTQLQADITAAANIASGGTGVVYLPASCNASTPLTISSTVTLPASMCLIGLDGEVHAAGTKGVEIDYNGSGIAFSSTNVNGACLENIRVKNTGTGTTGVDLAGTFNFVLKGVSIEGFGTNGLLMEDTATSSNIYNHISDVSLYHNPTELYLDQHNSSEAVNGNQFDNVQAFLPQGGSAIGVRFTGSANENVFHNLDVSHATTGVLVDANSGRDTKIEGLTAEGDTTIFNLGANVQNFRAEAIDGGFFNGINETSLVADGTATYSLCYGAYGNTADECQRVGVWRANYVEANTVQDPTGQAGIGVLQNLIKHSEAVDNSDWAKANGPAQTVGTGVTAPSGQTTANSITLNGAANPSTGCGGGSCTVTIAQSYDTGGSIQNQCYTFSEWFKLDGASAGTTIPFWTLALQDGAGGNQQFRNYPLTSAWTRGVVKNCYPSSTNHSVRPLVASIPAATNNASANGVIVDVWGMQVSNTNGAVPYVKTITSPITTSTVGLSGGMATTWAGMTPNVGATSTDFIAFGEDAGETVIGTESNAAGVWNQVGVASNLNCYVTTAAGASGDVMMVRKNGSNTALTCTVTNTNTTCTDITDNFIVAAGDKLDISVGGGSNTNATGVASCAFRING